MTFTRFRKIDPRLSTILGGAMGALGARLCGSALGFLSGVLVARALGASGLGIFAFANTIVGTLAVISSLGIIQILVREIAIHDSRANWRQIRGWLVLALKIGAVASFSFGSIAAIAAVIFLDDSAQSIFKETLLIALVGLPILVLAQFRQAAMRGLKFVALSMVPDQIVRPLIFVCILGVSYLVIGHRLSAPDLVIFSLIAAIIALVIGAGLLYRVLPTEVKNPPGEPPSASWPRMAAPIYMIAVMQIINQQADMLMLGFLSEPGELGIYSVARGLAEFIVYMLGAVALIMAPNIAQLFANREFSQLQYLIRKVAQLSLAAALPLVLLFLLAGSWILSLYGDDFVGAKQVLLILSAGQLVNVFCGPTGQIAVHTGNEKAASYIVGVAAMANIALNALLIPPYGATGAAIATTITVSLWNIGLSVYIRYKTGLSSLPLALPPRLPNK